MNRAVTVLFLCFVGVIALSHWRDTEFDILEDVIASDMKVLELSYLGLERFPTYFIGRHVTKVVLSHNKLKQLPEKFGDLINLTHLFVDNNYLSSLPTIFKQLKKLQELDLRNNELKGLSGNIADLKALKRLSLKGNPLTVKETRSLMKLLGKGRYIDILLEPDILEDVVANDLKVVELSDLGLQYFPTYYLGRSVTKVVLSHNKLKQLPEKFGDLINLTHLFVDNNYLSSLPTTFKELKKLQELDLRNNKLKRLSENISDLKILERLSVEGNPLTVEEIRSLMELMGKRLCYIDIAGKLKGLNKH